jgi:hypothetical protein
MINLICLGLFFPVMNLPVAVYVSKDLGPINIAIQVALCLLILFKVLGRGITFSEQHTTCLALLVALCFYGGVIGWSTVSHTVIFLGAKFLLLPLILCSVYLLEARDYRRIIKCAFLLQIANFVAVLFEIFVGQERLLLLGFNYGTNIRNLSGATRYPGLTLANYELGVFSAGVFVLALLSLKSMKFYLGVSRRHLLMVMVSSFGCLLGSSSRSGMLFVLIFFLSYMLFVEKNFSVFTICVTFGISTMSIALMKSSLLVDSASSKSRIELWGKLLDNGDLRYGAGLGTSGSASNSTYAGLGDRIFTDNQWIGFVLQFGVLGLLAFIFIFLALARAAVTETFPLVIALLVTSNFLELWDYTLFMTLMYLTIFRANLEEKQIREANLFL